MAQALVAHGAAASGGDGFGRWLRDTTALVLPGAPKNPFQAYSGLVSDAISRAEPRAAPPRPVVRPAPAQRTGLTAGIGWVREAYHRLERLITGQIRPASPQEARKVFAEAEITVVRRTTPTGSTTYLRDNLSGDSAASARISPRLNDRRIGEMLGRDPAADKVFAAERVAAAALRDAFTRAGYTRELAAGGLPFDGWPTMQFAVSSLYAPPANPHGLAMAYAVGTGPDGKEAAFFGLQTDVCCWEPDDTWTAMRDKAVGLGLRIPGGAGAPLDDAMKAALGQHFVFHPGFLPGSPILLRDANLVPAGQVHPRLRFDSMEAAFRAQADLRVRQARDSLAQAISPTEREAADRKLQEAIGDTADASFRKAVESLAGPRPADKVVDMSAIRAARALAVRMAEQSAIAPAPAPGQASGGRAGSRFDPAAVIIRYEQGCPKFYLECRKGGAPALSGGQAERPLPGVTCISDLPPGRYRVENEFQMPDGEMMVMPDGHTRRIGGNAMAEAETPAPSPAPVQDDGRHASGPAFAAR